MYQFSSFSFPLSLLCDFYLLSVCLYNNALFCFSPHQHNEVIADQVTGSGGSAVTYVELPLPRDAQPGYQVNATDLCLFAAKRKSVYLNAATGAVPDAKPSSPFPLPPSSPPTVVPGCQVPVTSATVSTTRPNTGLGRSATPPASMPVVYAAVNLVRGDESLLLLSPSSNNAPPHFYTTLEPRQIISSPFGGSYGHLPAMRSSVASADDRQRSSAHWSQNKATPHNNPHLPSAREMTRPRSVANIP